MSLDELRMEVFIANKKLVEYGLVVLTWGNASAIDREKGLVVIKPSGVSYDVMKPEHMVVVDLDGKVVEGDLRPSSDMPTHIALYNAWSEVGGVVHTHSTNATAFAQACVPIPCQGTTHADFCPGDVPCVRPLLEWEVANEYEANTGVAIIQHFRQQNLKPVEYPGALLSYHGPFTWGKNALVAADNALILENLALMSRLTRWINAGVQPIPEYIVQKHYSRKHGPNAYYGQK
ncbi:MAG: L-ribulose-5-phosphate 4-epimerase AraD [Planctomycetes bacterium]|nr:L-ribulose-5-phosphate 4-epimerase AraD [Planctomycetota bacterium]